MVGDDVLQELEPKKRQLRQNAPFAGNARRKHIVECRDAVSGDEQQAVFFRQAIDVTHFSAGMQLQPGNLCLQNDGIEYQMNAFGLKYCCEV